MTDARLETIIGNLLRTGVSLAAALVLAGGVWYLIDSGASAPHYRQFHPDVRGLAALATLPRPEALIFAGLLLLIATPVARVAFSLVAFVLERDGLYVLFTVIVLVILLYSLGTSWL
jgi:uncharacterized membrane protein